MFSTDVAGVEHWARAMNMLGVGCDRRGIAVPPEQIEEAEVLYGQTVVATPDAILFYEPDRSPSKPKKQPKAQH